MVEALRNPDRDKDWLKQETEEFITDPGGIDRNCFGRTTNVNLGMWDNKIDSGCKKMKESTEESKRVRTCDKEIRVIMIMDHNSFAYRG